MSEPLRLLLLEDEPSDAELILSSLRRSGLMVDAVIAADQAEFTAAVQGVSFDAILADNSLPQFSSIEALSFLRKEQMDTAFILVTGTVSEEFAVDVIKKGADDYILKGNLIRLPSAILQALEKRKARREKQEAESALIQSERRYRTLFQRNLAGIYQADTEGRITDCNNAFSKMLGYAHPAELRMVPARELFLSDDEMKQFLARLNYEKFLSNYEGCLRKKNGEAINVIQNATWVGNQGDEAQRIEGILIDITDRKKAEESLREINHELHELSSHLQTIREEERKEIARDVHDELGQLLTSMKMDVYSLKNDLKPGNQHLDTRFAGIIGLIAESVNSVRKIATRLRPSIIDDLGLVAAMTWQSQEVEKRCAIKVNFLCDMPDITTSALAVTNLFRIYQEALTNVVRHSKASQVDSSLRITDGRIVLEVRDNGIGIDSQAPARTKSFGLLGIRERVYVLKGDYALKSEPGKGTVLTVAFPLEVGTEAV